jgi:hypothetical protein
LCGITWRLSEVSAVFRSKPRLIIRSSRNLSSMSCIFRDMSRRDGDDRGTIRRLRVHISASCGIDVEFLYFSRIKRLLKFRSECELQDHHKKHFSSDGRRFPSTNSVCLPPRIAASLYMSLSEIECIRSSLITYNPVSGEIVGALASKSPALNSPIHEPNISRILV